MRKLACELRYRLVDKSPDRARRYARIEDFHRGIPESEKGQDLLPQEWEVLEPFCQEEVNFINLSSCDVYKMMYWVKSSPRPHLQHSFIR